MQKIKRLLAYILAFAMVFTAMPQNAFVYAAETQNEEESVESLATPSNVKSVNPDPLSTEKLSENLDDSSGMIFDGEISLSDGNPVNATTSGYYGFVPQEEGLYMFKLDSNNAQSVYVNAYFQDKMQYSYSSGTSVVRLMWLYPELMYHFYVTNVANGSSDLLDYTIQIVDKPLKIDSVKANDATKVCGSTQVDYTGVQLDMKLSPVAESDNTEYSIDSIADEEWFASRMFRGLDVFHWGDFGRSNKSSISPESIDDLSYISGSIQHKGYGTSAQYDADSHTYDYTSVVDGDAYDYYTFKANVYNNAASSFEQDFSIKFNKDTEYVQSIELKNASEKQEYYINLGKSLSSVDIIATLKGGSKDELSIDVSYGDACRYLEYTVDNDDGNTYSYRTESIDEWVKNTNPTFVDGKTEATAHVCYKGKTIPYTIIIKESPIKSISADIGRKTYYAGCSISANGLSNSGDNIPYPTNWTDWEVTYSDGTKGTYNSVNELNNYMVSKGYISSSQAGNMYNYYMEPADTTGYTQSYNGNNIDLYIANGGKLGDNYAVLKLYGATLKTPITIEEVNVQKIEILSQPSVIKIAKGSFFSVYDNQYAQGLSGLKFRVYYSDTEYEDINYDDYKMYYIDDETHTMVPVYNNPEMTKEKYEKFFAKFKIIVPGYQMPQYWDVGIYTITIGYGGKTADYNLEVVNSLISNFKVTPQKTEVLWSDTDNETTIRNKIRNTLNNSNTKVSFTDDTGVDREFNIFNSSLNEYQSKYNSYISFDTYSLEVTDPGENIAKYTVKCTWAGATFDIEIAVARSFVKDVKINSNLKTEYLVSTTYSGDKYIGTDNGYRYINLSDLDITLTYYNGVEKRYKYLYRGMWNSETQSYEIEAPYSSWSEISGNFSTNADEIDFTKVGTQKLIITVEGFTKEISLDIKDKLVDGVYIKHNPNNNEYIAGVDSWFNAYGLVIEVIKDDTHTYYCYNDNWDSYENAGDISESEKGSWEELEENGYRIDYSTVNFTTAGQYNAKLYYAGCTADIAATVKESPVTKVEILSMPNDTTVFQYKSNQGNFFDGLSLKVTFDDGQVNTVLFGKGASFDIEDNGKWYSVYFEGWEKNEQIDEGEEAYNLGAVGSNNAIINCAGKKVNVPMAILQDPVASIEVIQAPEKTVYSQTRGEKPELYGAKIKVSYIDGQSEIISIDKKRDTATNSYNSTYSNIGKYNEEISAYLNVYGTPSITISYMNVSYVYTNITLKELSEDIDGVIENDSTWIELTSDVKDEIPAKVYEITPSKTATYYIWNIAGGYNNNVNVCVSASNTTMGSIYYFATSNSPATFTLLAGTKYYITFKCSSVTNNLVYLTTDSSMTSDDVEIVDFKITDFPAANKYAFEQYISTDINLKGVKYTATYKIGEEKRSVSGEQIYSHYVLNADDTISVFGKELSVYWKNTYFDAESGDKYVSKTDGNSIEYTWGDISSSYAASFGNASPVESITVLNNPFETAKIYKSNYWSAMRKVSGQLRFKINYKDGTSEEVKFYNDCVACEINDYWASLDFAQSEEDTIDSYIKLSYMGCTAELPFTYSQLPVKNIYFKQRPSNTTICGDISWRMDLYGATITIEYTDGTSKDIAISEHCSSYYVDDEFESDIYAYCCWVESENGEGKNFINLEYANKEFTTDVEVDDVSFKKYVEKNSSTIIEHPSSISIVSNQTPGFSIYKIIPTETAEYTWTGEYNECDNFYAAIRNEQGVVLTSSYDEDSDGYVYTFTRKLYKGKTYYLTIMTGFNGSYTSSLVCGEPVRIKEVENVTVNSTALEPEQALPEISLAEETPENNLGYTISEINWSSDDATVGYSSTYQVKVVLKPDEDHKFTSATTAEFYVNDTKASRVTKSLSTDGKLTVTYTYPKTDALITFEGDSGEFEKVDNSSNVIKNKESFTFKYSATEDTISKYNLIVKVDGNITAPETVLATDVNASRRTIYTYKIANVTSNKTVSVKAVAKTKPEQKPETQKVTVDMYNGGNADTNWYDSIEAEKNKSISENKTEKKLPTIPSYQDEEEKLFFYGWYDTLTGGNGSGTRFISTTPVSEDAKVYARWGVGIFTYQYRTLPTQYKILSIDENNRMKLQLTQYEATDKTVVSNLTAGVSSRMILNLGAGDSEDSTGKADIPDSVPASALSSVGIADISGDMEITSIGESAFEGADVTTITLPDTVESIAPNAFAGCTKLEEISLPASIDTIPEGTFKGCENLKSVDIPEGVTTIEAGVFEGCTKLETVTVPDTVEEIAEGAFNTNSETTDSGSSTLTVVCSSDTVEKVKEVAGNNVHIINIDITTDVNELVFTKDKTSYTVSPAVNVTEDNEIVNGYTTTAELVGENTGYTVENNENGTYTVSIDNTKAMPSGVQTLKIYAEYGGVKKSATVTLRTAAISLTSKDLDGVGIYCLELSNYEYKYTGEELKPNVTVYDYSGSEEKTLEEGKDYEVVYSNNRDIGEATVEVNGIGWYSGTIEDYFNIYKKKNSIVTGSNVYNKKYGDATFNLGVTAASGANTIEYESSDPRVATVDASGNVNIVGIGTTTITVAAGNDIYNTVEENIIINVAKADKSITVPATTYSKTVGDAAFSLGASTAVGENLSYASSNPTVATVDANGTVTIVGAGTTTITISSPESANYNAAANVTVAIQVAAAQDSTPTPTPQPDPTPTPQPDPTPTPQPDPTPTPQPEPQPQEKAAKAIKVSKKSYTKAYGSKAFSLGAKTAAGEKLKYTTSDKKVVTVSALGKVTVKGIGKATITITSLESASYKAATPVKVTITVTPKSVKLSTVKNVKTKAIKVTWKKDTSVTGYEILYSQKSNFKGAKKVTVTKNKTVSATIKKLTKDKTYYVKVRAYKTVKGKKIYGAYSSVKKVKVIK